MHAADDSHNACLLNRDVEQSFAYMDQDFCDYAQLWTKTYVRFSAHSRVKFIAWIHPPDAELEKYPHMAIVSLLWTTYLCCARRILRSGSMRTAAFSRDGTPVGIVLPHRGLGADPLRSLTHRGDR